MPNYIETATEGWNTKPWGTEEDNEQNSTFDNSNEINNGNLNLKAEMGQTDLE